MDILEVEAKNPWWKDKNWERLDGKLTELEKQPLKYYYKIQISKGLNVIYGPRQVGKTTWIKQTIKRLIDRGEDPESILFLACDGMFSARELKETILETLRLKNIKYLFMDEVSFIENWEQVIKYLLDNGYLTEKFVVATGSSSINILKKSERLPGRKVKTRRFYPLRFKEFVSLKSKNPSYEELFHLFRRFLIHGGFLKAINEYELANGISEATLEMYSNAIDGELAKIKKNPRIMDYILSQVILKLTNTTSWSALAGNEVSQPTVAEYIEVAKDMLILQYIENRLSHEKAFIKNKKIYFTDPFLFWVAVYKTKNKRAVSIDSLEKYEGKLVENFVFSELLKMLDRGGRFNIRDELFYLKTRTHEVDFFYDNKKLEVKWKESMKNRGKEEITYLTKNSFGENKIPVYMYFYQTSK